MVACIIVHVCVCVVSVLVACHVRCEVCVCGECVGCMSCEVCVCGVLKVSLYSGNKSSPSSTPSNSSSSAGLALAVVIGRCGISPRGSV